MALTPKQRASLAKQGFTKKDIADIASATAPDDDDDAKPPARRGRRERHVAILTGPDADEFLTRVFGDTDADEPDDADDTDDADKPDDDADKPDDDADKPDDDADDADDDPEPDDKPKPRKGYFS